MKRRADTREIDRTTIAERFQRALDRCWLVFQPIIDIKQRSVFAYEALIRTDEDSMKRPDVLIATAERLDRVHDLGRVVRAAAVKAAPTLPDGGLLFVNGHGI